MLRPIQLQVHPQGWRVFTARKASKAFRAFKEKVLVRDEHTCQYCGFRSLEYQQVVNADSDYTNNKLSNLMTACCYCSQCLFLDSVGVGDYGGGTLIYLPEIGQADLNALCHVLFFAIATKSDYKNAAQTVYRAFKMRAQAVEKAYGEGTSNPRMFSQLIVDSGVDAAKAGELLLRDLRLLPSHAKFKQQIQYWAVEAGDMFEAMNKREIDPDVASSDRIDI